MTKLADIAAVLDVSTATISNALTGKGRMKEETRQQIRETALAMGYVMPQPARAKSNHIIVITEALEVEFCAQILCGLTAASRQLGVIYSIYDLGILRSGPGRDASVAQLRPLVEERIRQHPVLPACVIFLAQYPRSLPGLLSGLGCPAVGVYCYDSGAEVSITYDDQQGAYLAVNHLIQDGRQTIAMLSGPVDSRSVSERMIGYQRALIDHGLPYHPRLVWIGDWEVLSGKTLTAGLLQSSVRPDAIFAQNDVMAFGAVQAAREAGLRIPEDVAIIGFDNTFFASCTFPSLTSVAPPFARMGEAALKAALSLQKKEPIKQHTLCIPCTLALRNSTNR